MTTYAYEPADDTVDSALITRNGHAFLITGLSADHPNDHNQLAETLVRVFARPEIDAEIEAAVSELEARWQKEARS